MPTIAAGLEGAHLDGDRAAAGDDLLDPELLAFELSRRRVLVGELDDDRLAGGNRRFGRLELVVLERDLNLGFVVGERRRGDAGGKRDRQREEGKRRSGHRVLLDGIGGGERRPAPRRDAGQTGVGAIDAPMTASSKNGVGELAAASPAARVKTNLRASRRVASSSCIPSSLTGGFKARCRRARI